jgi:hypothetical protein
MAGDQKSDPWQDEKHREWYSLEKFKLYSGISKSESESMIGNGRNSESEPELKVALHYIRCHMELQVLALHNTGVMIRLHDMLVTCFYLSNVCWQ